MKNSSSYSGAVLCNLSLQCNRTKPESLKQLRQLLFQNFSFGMWYHGKQVYSWYAMLVFIKYVSSFYNIYNFIYGFNFSGFIPDDFLPF